ncbi:MAG: molybdopterin-dependent oxidoreductase, partial [Rhodospirillaceae bacterium]
MSHFLDRLTFFRKKNVASFSDGHGILTRENRDWEDAYRQRWQHDKIVRSTHGNNCTGGCSWKIYVKGGIITWETQQTDYPRTRPELPNHEPRGCQRGASYSWAVYGGNRLKYPLVRGRLVRLWREARKTLSPVDAWSAIQNDPKKRQDYIGVRGLGGFVRVSWEEANEIVAAANVHTVKTHGPDRICGFSPIPAMSMISYAAGSRYLSLIGGVPLSFYDWYCDLPVSSPQVWGEQTDVPESADWYSADFIMAWGSNVPQTRTPDAHFFTEARYKGTKTVAICPDYSEVAKLCDLWVAPKQGTDAAFGMALGHVILKEFHLEKKTPYFQEYCRSYTDMPFLVRLKKQGERYVPERFLRASDFDGGLGETVNPEWKTLALDETSGEVVVPNGTAGFRWGNPGKWNLELKDGRDGKEIKPRLSQIDRKDAVVTVGFPYFGGKHENEFFASTDHANILDRAVPVRTLKTGKEEVVVATVFDLLVANYGIDRGLGGGNVAKSYDEDVPYTPAWQEKITGVKRHQVLAVARDFAITAEKTEGRCMVIIGAAMNHWYHSDMNYRAVINMLTMCGCVGKPGGGWAHYVGQ